MKLIPQIFEWQYPSKGQFPEYNKECLVIPFKGKKYFRYLRSDEYGDAWIGIIKKWCYLPSDINN